MKLILEVDLSSETLMIPAEVQTAILSLSRALLEKVPEDAILGKSLQNNQRERGLAELVLAEMGEPFHKEDIDSPRNAPIVARIRFVDEAFDNSKYDGGGRPVRQEMRDGYGELVKTQVEL